MLIGYVRVSKSDGTQTLAPQRDAMLAAGVDPTRIYEDLASGRHDARPGLTACLKAIQPGNTLVLWKLDRLGRDLRHLVNTVEDLRTRGVGLKVLTGAGAQIDTTTANGRLAFGIFAAFADDAVSAVMRSRGSQNPGVTWVPWGAVLRIIPGHRLCEGECYARVSVTCAVARGANRDAINASGGLNCPRRSVGGRTASTASSFSDGSSRR